MKFARGRHAAYWIASLGASAVLAGGSSMVVLAEENPCLVNGDPKTAEWASQHPDLCDPGTGPGLAVEAAPAPAADTSAPAETPAPEASATDPAPTDSGTGVDAGTDTSSATGGAGDSATGGGEATTGTDTSTTDAGTDTTTTTTTTETSTGTGTDPTTGTTPTTDSTPTSDPVQDATPAPKRQPTRGVKGTKGTKGIKQPVQAQAPAAVEETSVATHDEDYTGADVETSFQDARVFREQFTPKGRIPEIPMLDDDTAATMVQVQKDTKVKWALIAAIAWMDSRWDNPVSGGFAGQRLSAAEWASHGTDGDADGVVDRGSEADQVATVGAFIASYANKGGSGAALRAYFNGRMPFVRRANYLAAYYDAVGAVAVSKGLDDEDARREIAERLLDDERITVYGGGRSDVDMGLIDPRVLVTVQFLANRFGEVTVTSLVTGHNVFTAGGNVSLHSYGQAVDIATVGGTSIFGNQQKNSVTTRALKDVLRMPESMQPVELISLWALGGPSIAMGDHHDHIHVGYKKVEDSAA